MEKCSTMLPPNCPSSLQAGCIQRSPPSSSLKATSLPMQKQRLSKMIDGRSCRTTTWAGISCTAKFGYNYLLASAFRTVPDGFLAIFPARCLAWLLVRASNPDALQTLKIMNFVSSIKDKRDLIKEELCITSGQEGGPMDDMQPSCGPDPPDSTLNAMCQVPPKFMNVQRVTTSANGVSASKKACWASICFDVGDADLLKDIMPYGLGTDRDYATYSSYKTSFYQVSELPLVWKIAALLGLAVGQPLSEFSTAKMLTIGLHGNYPPMIAARNKYYEAQVLKDLAVCVQHLETHKTDMEMLRMRLDEIRSEARLALQNRGMCTAESCATKSDEELVTACLGSQLATTANIQSPSDDEIQSSAKEQLGDMGKCAAYDTPDSVATACSASAGCRSQLISDGQNQIHSHTNLFRLDLLPDGNLALTRSGNSGAPSFNIWASHTSQLDGPSAGECYTGSGISYAGSLASTVSGRVCQRCALYACVPVTCLIARHNV